MKVLIDGENLRHQIAHVLHNKSMLQDWNEYFKFDTVSFLQDVLQLKDLDIMYYTTRVKQPKQKIPLKLKNKIETISASNRKWISDLSNQKIKIVKAGYLSVRESSTCIHCGKRTLNLQEKGVDVRVATDILTAAHGKEEKIVLVSSDSDLVPALAAGQSLGLKITYVCYSGWLNRSVAAQAYKTLTFDDGLVLKHYRGINK